VLGDQKAPGQVHGDGPFPRGQLEHVGRAVYGTAVKADPGVIVQDRDGPQSFGYLAYRGLNAGLVADIAWYWQARSAEVAR
jgi:hypothetical protein